MPAGYGILGVAEDLLTTQTPLILITFNLQVFLKHIKI
jgi:hypothetical protein